MVNIPPRRCNIRKKLMSSWNFITKRGGKENMCENGAGFTDV